MTKTNLLLIIAIIISCNSKSRPKGNQELSKKAPPINVLDQFTKSYPVDLVCDSNSLIFYVSKSFDTSYLLQINNTSNFNNCICYYVPPANQRGLLAEPKKHIAFNGFNFFIDSIKWQNVKRSIKTFDLNNIESCADCSFVYFSINGIKKSGYIETNKSLDELEKYFKKEFFNSSSINGLGIIN
jgi:hypothetical protein